MWSTLPQADELPTLNMTPMVDVMLCLLIFFMAATRLYDWDEQQFEVRVPEVAQASPLTNAPDDLQLVVVEPGRVLLNGDELDLQALEQALRAARERFPDQGVLLRGEASLSYQDVADVLSVCELAGLRNVRLPVRPRPTASAP